MHPDLRRCLALLDEGTAGLDEKAAVARSDGRWSIAEIVEHLDRTYSGTTKGFDRCLQAGVPRASRHTLKSRLRVWVVVTCGYFPSGVEAPSHVVPTGQLSLSAVMEQVRTHLAALEEVALTARARFGTGRVMDHPVLGPLSVNQWLKFHRIHTQHHYRQIIERRARLERAG